VAHAIVTIVAIGIISGDTALAMPPARPVATTAVFAATAVVPTNAAAVDVAAPKLDQDAGRLAAMTPETAHTTAARDRAQDPFNTSKEFDNLAVKMTSDFASSLAAE
jgi:hypothetical protein